MSFTIMSIASSSAGNCYLVRTDNTNILVDIGISFKRIKDNLALQGLNPDDIDAILITHEHSDHILGLRTAIKKMKNATVYLSRGTYDGIKSNSNETFLELFIRSNQVKVLENRDAFFVKDIIVNPFKVSHDTNEPFMYSLIANSKKVSIVTDTGYITDEIFDNIRLADTLVIESNHEPNILLYGSYPYMIKQRILSNFGHLSNEACARCLVKILEENKSPNVFLAHLSDKNNTPEQALLTISNFLEEEGFLIGRDINIEILKKDQASRVIEI